MKKAALVLIMALLIPGCSSTPDVDEKKMNPLFTNNSPGKYGAGTKFYKPMAWSVGQWITLGNITNGAKYSVTKYSIVGKEDGGYIVECVTTDSGSTQVIQYLIKGIDQMIKKADTSSIEIVWLKIKQGDGEVQQIEGFMMQAYKAMTSSMLGSIQSTSTFTDGGTVTVPAGTFSGVNVIKSEGKILGFTVKSTGYFHNSVPINGMVKSISDDGETETVLIAFGKSGAKPVIPLK